MAVQASSRNWRPLAILIALLTLGGIICFGAYKFIAGNKTAKKLTIAYQNMKITPLTSTGKISSAAISPDGKYVVQATSDAGQQSVWVRQVATTSDVQIIPPSGSDYGGLTFSPDGNFIYYLVQKKGDNVSTLYQIPVLGGTARKIIDDVDSRISFSPDQKQFAFLRGTYERGETLLMIANTDGSGETKLASRKVPEVIGSPAWSPDGKNILCFAYEQNQGKMVEIDVKDGTEKTFGNKKWQGISRIMWTADGGGLIISAVEPGEEKFQIYYLSYPEAELQRITNDTNSYNGIGQTTDSSTLLAIKTDQQSEIWLANDSAHIDNAKQITLSKSDGCCGISWTPDNRILFSSTAGGSLDIWSMNPDGSKKKQLTNNAQGNVNPLVPPDGKSIVFLSNRSGTYEAWKMDSEGGNLTQLSKDKNIGSLNLTSDGKWLIYASMKEGKSILWKMPFDGGEATQITNNNSYMPNVSPDGKTIVYLLWDEQSKKMNLTVADFETGQVKRSSEVAPNVKGNFSWLPDGKTLAFIDSHGGVDNIWTQGIEGGGKPKQLTNFKSDLIFFINGRATANNSRFHGAISKAMWF